MNFRHEWKHAIRYSDLLALRVRLAALLDRDPHAVDGRYCIRSLYFDNLADKALREKLDGVNTREKFRIRLYNGDCSYILLEKKSKIHGLCSKAQAVMTMEETQAALAREPERLSHSSSPLVQELGRKMCTQGLRPKTIVDYTREPFIYGAGNVRVTLDYDIRTGLGCTDLLDPDCITVPARDAPAILEVKWDTFLPALVRDAVQVPGTHTSAFSKYAACRIYG